MSFTSRFLPLEIGRRDLSLCLTGCTSISLRSLNSSSTRKWVNTLKLSSDYSFTKKGKRKTNNYKYINAFSCLLAIIDPFWFDWSFKELFTKRVGYELISENNVRSSNFLAISTLLAFLASGQTTSNVLCRLLWQPHFFSKTWKKYRAMYINLLKLELNFIIFNKTHHNIPKKIHSRLLANTLIYGKRFHFEYNSNIR